MGSLPPVPGDTTAVVVVVVSSRPSPKECRNALGTTGRGWVPSAASAAAGGAFRLSSHLDSLSTPEGGIRNRLGQCLLLPSGDFFF
ncbi:hypothetical protein QG37_04796 [Candidozyma auris]|nr:hypothetical protein QG37_04796 [[Candida] auris]